MKLTQLIKKAAFKAMILSKAKLCKGNIKTGKNILTWSKLYSSMLFFIPALNTRVKGSCKRKYCKGCSKDCYVKKSYRYKSVILSHAIRTIAIRYYLPELKERLSLQLSRMKNKPQYVRIHQSGEYEYLQEFIMWIDIARNNPGTIFFSYTKAFDIVIPYLLQHEKELPDNFIILISVWNKYGIKEYLQVKHIPTVKAFCVNTGYNYAAAGIDITTTCKAYVGKKLNHNLTCEKCKKCMVCNDTNKCILCDEH